MELAWIREHLPEGVRIERDLSQLSNLIGLAVDNVAAALRGGAVLMAIILFRFLRDFRTTGISILAIPLSLPVALLSLRLFGGTINTMTLR
jgi:Cu/Ag efflux pump CusA